MGRLKSRELLACVSEARAVRLAGTQGWLVVLTHLRELISAKAERASAERQGGSAGLLLGARSAGSP